MEDAIAKTPESRFRRTRLVWWFVVVYGALGILLVINQTWGLRIAGFMPLASGYYYYIIFFFLPLVYIIFPATRSAPTHKVPWYDWFLLLLCLAPVIRKNMDRGAHAIRLLRNRRRAWPALILRVSPNIHACHRSRRKKFLKRSHLF